MDVDDKKKDQQDFEERTKSVVQTIQALQRRTEEKERRIVEAEHAEGFITLKQDISLPSDLFEREHWHHEENPGPNGRHCLRWNYGPDDLA